MSGLDDLGRALRDDAAANAPRASTIDVDAVARAARARRAPRLLGVGALAVVGALGLGGLAVGALAPPALIAAGESTDTGTSDALPESLGAGDGDADGGGAAPQEEGDLSRLNGSVACGEPVDDELSVDTRLALEVLLPTSVESGLGQVGDGAAAPPSGVVRIVNTAEEPVSVQTRSAAFAALVLDGVVVGEGTIVADVGVAAKLDPGVSLGVPVAVVTVSCVDGTPLPAGDYTVLVSVDAWTSEGGPLTRLVALAGPVRVE